MVDEGGRIAQLIIEHYINAEPFVDDEYPFDGETSSSTFGLGSTSYMLLKYQK